MSSVHISSPAMKHSRSVVLLCAIILTSSSVQSATIQRRSADIPVHIVYDEPIAPAASIRNLQAKVQLPLEASVVVLEAAVTPQETIKVPAATIDEPTPTVKTPIVPQVETIKEDTPAVASAAAGLKNLAEKPQLSLEQLRLEKTKIVTPEIEYINTNQLNNHFKDENIDDIYQKIEEIVLEGAGKIRVNIDKGSDKIDAVTKDKIHEKFNETINDFLETTKKGQLLRGVQLEGVKQAPAATAAPPTNQNFLQQAIGNIQVAATNFISNFQGTATQSDEPAASNNPVQFVISQVNSGIQQFANNFNNLGGGIANTQNTVLGDVPVTAAPNPVQQFINGGQQIVQNVQSFFNPGGSSTGTQGDESTNPATTFITQVQNGIQQLNPFNRPAAGAAADEAAPAATGISGVFQQIQQLNPFNRPPAAAAQGDTAAPAAPSNPIIGVIQQVASGAQQAGQNIVSQFVPASAASEAAADGAAPTNPIVDFAQNVQTSVGQLIPAGLNPTAAIGAIQQTIAGAPVSESSEAPPTKSESIDENKVTSD